jgi:hypothetical protein
MNDEAMSRYDLFISHASEDKASLVEPLATILSTYGVNVWYDVFTLEPGDSLSKSIDRGLTDSRYGVVILSPSFFCKPWPEYELRGLVSKELGRDKVIIPVWFGVSREQILSYSPPLADKLAINASSLSCEAVAAELLRVVRPDLHSKFRRLVLSENLDGESLPLRKLVAGKFRHSVFPKTIMSRINIVRHIFFEFLPETLEQSTEHFRRDSYPEEEIASWEAMAAVYLDFIRDYSPSLGQRKVAFNALLKLSAGAPPSEDVALIGALSADHASYLQDRWVSFGIQLPISAAPCSTPNDRDSV